jgi:4-hydroxyphenylpyruvate dioxygenase
MVTTDPERTQRLGHAGADLGILGVEGIHYYVRDLERARRFYVERLDFEEIGESGPGLREGGRQRSVAFRAGQCLVVCSSPLGVGGRAYRYLRMHPDGVGSIVFQVEDAERAFALLDRRGGTPIQGVQTFEVPGGTLKTFVITTPFGDTTFRFQERSGVAPLFPGFEPYDQPRGGDNRFGFQFFDHITSNFATMSPALLWLEHVLGFQRFWDVQFHTDDVHGEPGDHGSGLRSVVMWDPASRVKFANNEPYRPHFKESQINIFHEENRGDGVQHVALHVADILSCVRGLRERGVEFMPTPATYYELLPARLEAMGIGAIDEDIEELAQLGILVDGDGARSYLLQIFLKDSAGLYGDPEAGPFFYEIIQRKGDRGFGAGNFRALFESIERQQQKSRGLARGDE